ncbi:MAG: hypothetical protein IAF08_10825 [Rhizobacter sp.]|nr:hypothetical protein [Chlorobiales bacterium]
MPLKRENYILLAIGVAGIMLSYLLMVLDNQVDGFVSVTLCPILLVLSYSEIVFALLYKKPVQPETESDVPSNGISNAA